VKARPSVEEQLAALDALPAERAAQAALLKESLGARHYRVAGKAARLAEDSLHYDLIPALVEAYARFADKPAKQDPSCIAKKAIARALVALDCDDSQFFIRGLACRQLEPVWGGTRDTAAEVRAAAAMGLVATGYPRALVLLATLLYDPEPEARIGAVRAIACGNPREAELLLHSKVLAGDAEPAVLGECFAGLIGAEPEESLDFVAQHLRAGDEATRELAALALGESRLAAALAPLEEAWRGVLVPSGLRRALVRAMAAHRSEAAFEWLLTRVAEERGPVVSEVIDALAAYRHNDKLAARLEAQLEERDEPALFAEFEALWKRD
jgi:HEAT repeat protein